MRTHTKILAGTVILAAAGWIAGCNGTVDDEPNVVLEISTMTIPPVTAATSAGVCTFTVPASSATFLNKPKNSLSGGSVYPYNDIVLDNVVIDYTWDDGVTQVNDQIFGIAGTVPAGGTANSTFSVANSAILSTVLSGGGGVDGHTARMSMVFHGTTISGDAVVGRTGGTLVINSCLAATLGACCTGGGGCTTLSQTDCTAAGGAYAGDNTSCLTAVCP
jgi:hypothetical protein